jgi:excisionase family DNA binding protein
MKRPSPGPKGSKTAASPVLTIEETAALFRTSVKTIRKAIRAGELDTFKLGRTTFVLREPLEKRLRAKIPFGASPPGTAASTPPQKRIPKEPSM